MKVISSAYRSARQLASRARRRWPERSSECSRFLRRGNRQCRRRSPHKDDRRAMSVAHWQWPHPENQRPISTSNVEYLLGADPPEFLIGTADCWHPHPSRSTPHYQRPSATVAVTPDNRRNFGGSRQSLEVRGIAPRRRDHFGIARHPVLSFGPLAKRRRSI